MKSKFNVVLIFPGELQSKFTATFTFSDKLEKDISITLEKYVILKTLHNNR